MRPLYDCIKEEKSEADKMFEELGYTKVEDSTYRERILLRLIDKQNKIINLIAEDYSDFQINKSKIGEITETKYGILDRVCKLLKEE